MRQRLFIVAAVACLAMSAATPVVAAGPSVEVTSPRLGENLTTSDIEVVFHTADFDIMQSTVPVAEAGHHPEMNQAGQGHMHLTLDVQPLVIWTSNAPYTFHDVAFGPHLLRVELVNADHSSLVPPVIQQVQFRTGPGQLPNTGSAPADWPPLLLLFGGAAATLTGLCARVIEASRRRASP
jgi:hypothetical protein